MRKNKCVHVIINYVAVVTHRDVDKGLTKNIIFGLYSNTRDRREES